MLPRNAFPQKMGHPICPPCTPFVLLPRVCGKITLPLHRQIAGPCGEEVNTSSLVPWEASYDGSALTAEDDTPSEGDSGR